MLIAMQRCETLFVKKYHSLKFLYPSLSFHAKSSYYNNSFKIFGLDESKDQNNDGKVKRALPKTMVTKFLKRKLPVENKLSDLQKVNTPADLDDFVSSSSSLVNNDFVSNSLVNNENSNVEEEAVSPFSAGQKVRVKVTQFGPMGASVMINDGEGYGLIIQKEIALFRDKREGIDVLMGEELDGYVARIRDDLKIDVSLRPIGNDRYVETTFMVLDALQVCPDGKIPLGDKSSPEDVSHYFHGLSKKDFKSALGKLFKQGAILRPLDYETNINPDFNMDSIDINKDFGKSNNNLIQNKIQNDLISDVTPKRDDSLAIFIGNLPPTITATILRNILEKEIGGINPKHIRLPTDSITQKPRGYAWVDLPNVDKVEEAIRKLKGFEVMGRAIRVDYASQGKFSSKTEKKNITGEKLWKKVDNDVEVRSDKKQWVKEATNDLQNKKKSDLIRKSDGYNANKGRSEFPNRKPEATLYFGNLAYAVTEDVLRKSVEDFMDKNGAVASVRIASDKETGRKRGFGYVDFYKVNDAEKIYQEMHDIEILGRKVIIDFNTRA
eukprot:gene12002-16069_t